MTYQEAKDLHSRIINKGKYLVSHEVITMDKCRRLIDRGYEIPFDIGEDLRAIYQRIRKCH